MLILRHWPRVEHLSRALLSCLSTLVSQADGMSVGFPVTHVLVKQILNLVVNFASYMTYNKGVIVESVRKKI